MMPPRNPDRTGADKSPELRACFERIGALKAELDTYRPLPPEQAESLKAVYDLQQTFHSNAIEGNTLSYEETRMVLEHGLTIAGKPLKDHLEAINHAEAIHFVESLATKPSHGIREEDILKIHTLILHAIDTPWAGKYREFPVYVTRQNGSIVTFADQAAVPSLMRGAVAALIDEAEVGVAPVTLATNAHFRLVNIHPFKDGNGRTARLLMNLILIQNGFPPTVIHVEDRDRYIELIEQARSGDMSGFELFICKSVEQSLEQILTIVRNGGLIK